jgi:hypothetical protein
MNRKGIISVTAIMLLIAGIFATTVLADPKNGQKEISSDKDLRLLAKQMDLPYDNEKQKNDVSEKLAALKPNEAIAFKKIWRNEQVLKGTITQEETLAFPALEKTEIIFSEKVRELYGENATIYNISPSEFSAAEKALTGDIAFRELVYSVENTLATASSKDGQVSIAFGCYYDNNWPQWFTAVSPSGTYFTGGGSGRVANDAPDEWPCDFVIYIPANTYTKVSGATVGAQNVVEYDGGLSGSPSRDAAIVGYWRVWLYGTTTEEWVRNNILFKW